MKDNNQIIIYQTEDGQTQVDVRMENDTVWLTQAQMAELFQKDRTVVGRHIRNVYKEGELEVEGTCAKFAHMGNDGLQRYETVLYNLDVIISVGYRVKSHRGVQFRRWANKILKEYLVKGYAVNDRLRRDQLGELRQLVQVVGRTLQNQDVTTTPDGQARPEIFPYVNDYRNSVVAEMMRTLNYVNMFNHGVGEVCDLLRANGSPEPTFKVGLLTAFSVIVEEPKAENCSPACH